MFVDVACLFVCFWYWRSNLGFPPALLTWKMYPFHTGSHQIPAPFWHQLIQSLKFSFIKYHVNILRHNSSLVIKLWNQKNCVFPDYNSWISFQQMLLFWRQESKKNSSGFSVSLKTVGTTFIPFHFIYLLLFILFAYYFFQCSCAGWRVTIWGILGDLLPYENSLVLEREMRVLLNTKHLGMVAKGKTGSNPSVSHPTFFVYFF